MVGGAHLTPAFVADSSTRICCFTQDEDFLFSKGPLAIIVVSRVRQSRPLRERIEVWQSAVEQLIANPPTDRRFDLMDDGQLLPWTEGPPNVWTRKAPEPKS